MSYISIIIPSFLHLDSLKKCLQGIIKHTNLNNVEVVVVANGCNDGTSEYVKSLGEQFLLLDFPEPLGYTVATNKGIKYALPHSDYIILLNNDAYPTGDSWLETLIKPFDDPLVGISGPTKLYNNITKRQFLIGYCMCIKKEILENIGILDEVFSPGYGEDVDLCMKAEKAGYKLAQVPFEGAAKVVNGVWVGPYPMTHDAETTVHDPACMPNWDEVKEKNIKVLQERYGQPKVIAAIPTKGRYHTTLPMTISSILNQTRKPDYILIGDDNKEGEWEDLTKDPTFVPLFQWANTMGIGVWVAYAPKKGLVWNNQMCQDYAINNGYDLVWRLDDDVVPEPNTLETLLSYMTPKVGCVGCPVLVPGTTPATPPFCVSVEKVGVLPNVQWSENEPDQELEHLHCSFLYRPGIAKYNLNLSPLSMTEETQFTHEIYREGYKVLFTSKTKIWHLKQESGGCRNYDQQQMWNHDRAVFDKKLSEWRGEVQPFEIYLFNGLGDHICFSNLISELLEIHSKIRIACTYPDVFNQWKNDPRVSIIHTSQSSVNPDEYNIYQKMMDWRWEKTLLEAFRHLYLSPPIKTIDELEKKRYNAKNNWWVIERAAYNSTIPVHDRDLLRCQFAASKIKEGENVLDVGCSTGYFSQFLPKGCTYLGYEIDNDVIEFAKHEFPMGNYQNIDLEKEPINGYWDTIVALEILEHLSNGLELAQELKKHCNQLIISVPCGEEQEDNGYHKLWGLQAEHFPDFSYSYINLDNSISTKGEGKGTLLLTWSKNG